MLPASLSPNELELIMTLEQWEKDNAAFLIKIGQIAPAAPKTATKKDEE